MPTFPHLLIAPPDTSTWDDDIATSRRIQGELVHQALALLAHGESSEKDVTRRVHQARTLLGIHPQAVDTTPLVESILGLLDSPDIAMFFEPGTQTWAEQEIVAPSLAGSETPRLLRVDRIALLPDNSLWALDFKLGPGDPDKDLAQLKKYQELIAGIFQRPCHGAVIHLETARKLELPPAAPRPGPYSPLGSPTFAPSHCQPRPEAAPYPITVFPLGADLLALLHAELLQICAPGTTQVPGRPLAMAEIQIIFPHRRPKLYLLQKLAQSLGVPFLPPQCLSLEDWIRYQACLMLDAPVSEATLLDQAWLLYALHERIPGAQGSAWHQFLPWGIRLGQVMDELDREKVIAQNIAPLPDDIPAMAANMLSGLGSLQQDFHESLVELGLTTQALLAQGIAPEKIRLASRTYICGLFALTRSEADLVQALRQRGARIWWQSERPLPEQLGRWVKAWQAPIEWIEEEPDARSRNPADQSKTTYIQSHDLHSQLRDLTANMTSWDPEENIAIILPEASLLRPLLAHLPPERQINLTLGMPLDRTALGALISTLQRAARDRQISGIEPNHMELLDFLQSPWVRRLLPEGMNSWLKHVLTQKMSTSLEAGQLTLLLEQARERFDDPGRLADLANLFLEALRLESLADLADFLKRFVNVLRVEDMIRLPLEMHAVHALRMRIIPMLERSLSSDQAMPGGSLWSVFQTALQAERIPFSGEPLTPWQVMGLLESRLLNFDKVVVLECLEGSLPAAQPPNPLLPEAIRPVLGLPAAYSEERIVRHHFQRLLASANEVTLYSRKGLSADPLEGKKSPSRYWEQLLWADEKRLGMRLDDHIATVPLQLDLGQSLAALPEKHAWAPMLHHRLGRGLSLSALNTYLTCPVKFFYEQVANYPSRPDPASDPGAAAMGNLAHLVLERLFAPYVHQCVNPRDLVPALHRIWEECVALSLQDVQLSAASRFFHVRLLSKLLTNYLEKATAPVCPIMIEQSMQRSLPGRAQSILLRGRLDRIDKDVSTEKHLILDYKTGAAPIKQSLSLDQLRELTHALDQAPLDQDSLIQVNDTIQDMQLPGYLFLYNEPAHCGFWQIGIWDQKKAFMPLMKTDKKGAASSLEDFFAWQRDGLPLLMEWLGRHILEAPAFFPACQAQSCAFCSWQPVCPWTRW